MSRVFISYSHAQIDWVKDDLCPVIEAGGAEPLVDFQRFTAGRAVAGQMDGTQDQAEVNLLVLSPDYINSDYCMHELRRAIKRDPGFASGRVVPIVRIDCELPEEIKTPNPLYVDLRDGSALEPWRRLLKACGADLGCAASNWLQARRQVVEALGRDESINLVIRERVRSWRALIENSRQMLFERHGNRELGVVDLQSGATATQRGLLEEILRACGSPADLPLERNEDLVAFTRKIRSRNAPALVALYHFDCAVLPDRSYSMSLFTALRDLISTERKLCVIIHSKEPFLELLPYNHPLSSLTQLRLLELKAC